MQRDIAKLGGTEEFLRAGGVGAGVHGRSRCAYWGTWKASGGGVGWDFVHRASERSLEDGCDSLGGSGGKCKATTVRSRGCGKGPSRIALETELPGLCGMRKEQSEGL